MAYYYRGELPENGMGHVLLGAAFVDEDTHAKILAAKEQFIGIVNKYTLDCGLSRKSGVAITAPKVHSGSIGCHLTYRGEDLLLPALMSTPYVTYWLNCFSIPNQHQVLSSHETSACAKEVEELFKMLSTNKSDANNV